MSLFEKIFGTYSERELKKNKSIVEKILRLEHEFEKLTESELKAKTEQFKARLAAGESLDDT